MPESNAINLLHQHLIELGCPLKAVRRIVRETAEHLEDLQQAALKQGLAPTDAAKQAEQQLGDPIILAERHVQVLRNSSWWGRIPLVGFGVLPAATVLLFWLGYMSINNGEVPGVVWNLLTSMKDARAVLLGYFILCAATLAPTAIMTFFFWWRARKAMVDQAWLWLAGIILAVNGLYLLIEPSPNQRINLNYQTSSVMEMPANFPEQMLPSNMLDRWAKMQRDDGDSIAFDIDASTIDNTALKHDLWGRLAPAPLSLWDSRWSASEEGRTGVEWIRSTFRWTPSKQSGTSHRLFAPIKPQTNNTHSPYAQHTRFDFWNYISESQLRDFKAMTIVLGAAGVAEKTPILINVWNGRSLVLPLPQINYFHNVTYPAGWLHWINVALPLVIIALLLAWQRWEGAARLRPYKGLVILR